MSHANELQLELQSESTKKKRKKKQKLAAQPLLGSAASLACTFRAAFLWKANESECERVRESALIDCLELAKVPADLPRTEANAIVCGLLLCCPVAGLTFSTAMLCVCALCVCALCDASFPAQHFTLNLALIDVLGCFDFELSLTKIS